DADPGELGQLSDGRRPGAFGCEGSDVQLVHDLPFDSHAAPRGVVPPERRRIDDDRGAVRSVRLVPRRWIRVQLLVRVDAQLIAIASRRWEFACEVPVRVARQLDVGIVDVHRDAPARGRPDAEVRTAVADQLGANWQAPFESNG